MFPAFMVHRFVAFTLTLLITVPALAQDMSSAGKVKVESQVSLAVKDVGGEATLKLVVHIEPGWHINSHTPSSDFMIATSFELAPTPGVTVKNIKYPPGKDVKLDFDEKPINAYEETIEILAQLGIDGSAMSGRKVLKGALTVQACDNQVCLAPADIPVEVTFEFVSRPAPKGASRPATETEPLAMDSAPKSQQSGNTGSVVQTGPDQTLPPVQQNELAKVFEERGSVLAFLAIFVIGLALNLTPCVYPMLSITVSLFGTQTETNVWRVFVKAVVYVLGMATMYSVLGVSAAFGGGMFGSWLQSPFVLGGIAALLFALALSSFGVYQIQMPYWLTSKLGGTTGTGLVSLYLSGLVVGVFAAPCVGPPVIALMTLVAAKGDPMFGFWSFFILSLGLGFPYLILGTFSGLLKKIPRSGPWLVWVEHIFGVILVGAALFYLSLAVAPKYSSYVIPVVLVVGGIYLGFLDRSAKGKNVQRYVQWVFGVVSVVAGLLLGNALRAQGVEWEKYTEERILQAKSEGKVVVLDFYADWCIPCIELDKKTYTDGKVIDAMENTVRLKVDLTHYDSPESEALRKRFSISGVPTVVFLGTNGEEVASSRIVGFVPPGDFLERLKPVVGL